MHEKISTSKVNFLFQLYPTRAGLSVANPHFMWIHNCARVVGRMPPPPQKKKTIFKNKGAIWCILCVLMCFISTENQQF